MNTGDIKLREVTGITDKFKILDDTWLFGANPATPEAEWKHQQESRSKKAKASEMQGSSVPISISSHQVIAKDERDIVEFEGHRFAPNVVRVRDLGECFWDTLRAYGIEESILSSAASSCNVPMDKSFSTENIPDFVNALAKAGRKVKIVLVIFDIFKLTHLSTLQFAPEGGATEELYFGFFMDEQSKQGHYVPELGARKK
jgi:hypothetical protein